MNFKEATDILFESVPQRDFAKILGVSVATIRQARLREDAKAHRTPPGDWEKAVIKLAGDRIRVYQRLISRLASSQQGTLPLSGS